MHIAGERTRFRAFADEEVAVLYRLTHGVPLREFRARGTPELLALMDEIADEVDQREAGGAHIMCYPAKAMRMDETA